MEKRNLMDVIELIEKGSSILDGIIREQPYGIVYKTAEIEYGGMRGRLVWDYIIWNELTFEDIKTGKKYSLATSMSDKKMEQLFDDYVTKYKM